MLLNEIFALGEDVSVGNSGGISATTLEETAHADVEIIRSSFGRKDGFESGVIVPSIAYLR